MEATKDQKKQIRANFKYDVNLKEEAVQWATKDNSKTSLNDLTFEQAARIIAGQTGKPIQKAPVSSWGKFDKANAKHKLILSLLRTAGWVTIVPKYGKVADIERFGNWLEFDVKSPVKKPLLKMEPHEVEKVIKALNGIIKSIYK